MNAKIKRYVKERDEMLKKCDIGAFVQFVRDHADDLPDGFVGRIEAASDELKLCVMHKMIVNAVKLPKELRDKSALWLVSRGYTLQI